MSEEYKQKPRFVRNSNFVLREIVGEYLLIPIRHTGTNMESFYAINQIAAFIWKGLETPKSLDEMAVLLGNEYDISKKQALQDIREFIAGLTEKEIIFDSALK